MPGPDRVWTVDVKAGQRLEATVTTTLAAPAFNASLYFVDSCAAQIQSCLASSDKAGGATETVAWTNKTSATKRIYVVVDSARSAPTSSETNAGKFDLLLELYDGDICSNAELLVPPFSMTFDNAHFGDDYYAADAGHRECRLSDDPDRVVAFDLPSGKRAILKTSGQGAYYAMAQVGSAADCVPNLDTCSATSEYDDQLESRQLVAFNPSPSTQRTYVIIDGTGEGRLTGVLDTPPAGDRCENAEPLATNTTVNVTFTGFQSDYSNVDFGIALIDRAYWLDVPANTQLRVAFAADSYVDINFATTPQACQQNNWSLSDQFQPGGSVAQLDLKYNNPAPSAQRIYVVLNGYSYSSASLQATFAPILAGDRCETALPVSAGVPLTGLSTSGYAHDYRYTMSSGICANWGDPDRVFKFTVPAGQRAVTSSSSGTINLFSSAACQADIKECLAFSAQKAAALYNDGPATWVNNTGVQANVMASVSTSEPTFSFNYAAVPVLVGDTCENPMPVGAGTYSHTLVGYYRDRPLVSHFGNCPWSDGRDRLYRATVPAGQTVRVSVTPASTDYDARLVLLADSPFSCTASSARCIDGASTGVGTTIPAQVEWSNRGTTSQDILIEVATTTEATEELAAYTLDISFASVASAPGGDICETASVISVGTLAAQTTTSFARDYDWRWGNHAGVCAEFPSGKDRAYAVDVPNGKRLNAHVVPATGVTAVINLVRGPAPNCNANSFCLSGSEYGEDATWLNDSGVTQRVFIVVTANGTFDLVSSLQ